MPTTASPSPLFAGTLLPSTTWSGISAATTYPVSATRHLAPRSWGQPPAPPSSATPVATENSVRREIVCELPNHGMIQRHGALDWTSVQMAGVVPEIGSAAPSGEHGTPPPAKHFGSAGAETPSTV